MSDFDKPVSFTVSLEGYDCVRTDCQRAPGPDCRSCMQRWAKGEVTTVARDYSTYNAPFCHHPLKCGPVGRCLREIACND